MRQVELDGAQMAKVISAILGDPELALSRGHGTKMSTVVPRHPRAMDRQAA